jgi:hypothetical protein
MDPYSVLATLAQIAATFVGFTGVIFAVGRFSGGAWKGAERNAFLNLLLPSTIALFMAFVPMIASDAMADAAVWRFSNLILALVHAPLVTSALVLALRGQLAEPLPLRFVLIPGGYASVIASALVALGLLQDVAAIAFTGGLVWFLFVAATQFVLLIVPKQGRSE